jgi:uncharacterized repeat protein (TIGR01451 family)
MKLISKWLKLRMLMAMAVGGLCACTVHAQVSGIKPLYLDPDTGNLSRIPPVAQAHTQIQNSEAYSYTLNPSLAASTTVEAGSISIPLWMAQSGQSAARSMLISLYYDNNDGSGEQLIDSVSTNFPNMSGTATELVFRLNAGADIALASGAVVRLEIINQSGRNGRNIRLYNMSGGSYSSVNLPLSTVINVDSVAFYDDVYPGGNMISHAVLGDTVYIRSVVSDPFGAFDITGADITLSGPGGVSTNSGMTEVTSSGELKTYEMPYTIPPGSPEGTWTADVTAYEGLEGAIEHTGSAVLDSVSGLPNLEIMKVSYVHSDPVNGSAAAGNNPKRIPGAVIQYQVVVNNSGSGGGDADSIVVSDVIPPNTVMLVDNQYGSGPVQFVAGGSGLTYSFTSLGDGSDDIEFLNSASGSITPTVGSDGSDPNVHSIRLNPKGQLNDNSTFEFRFRVIIE